MINPARRKLDSQIRREQALRDRDRAAFGALSLSAMPETLGMGALPETVVEGFEADALTVELAFGPLMTIEANLDGIGGVGANLDEGFVEVEIVLSDEDRLAGVQELNETPVRGKAFGGFEGLGLFLSDADKDDAIADRMLATHPSGDFVFALAFLEVDDRELLALNVVLDAAHVTLGELTQEGGRGNRKLQVTYSSRIALIVGGVWAELSWFEHPGNPRLAQVLPDLEKILQSQLSQSPA